MPRNIPDAHQELLKMLAPCVVEQVEHRTQADMVDYHFLLGLWMRNSWGLWSGSRLGEKPRGAGFVHPDEMSGVIPDTFWRHLNGQPLGIEEQIAKYERYCKKQKARESASDEQQKDKQV